jgi:predicted GH43/DUF377 family glycosyl hydrolase
MTAEQPAPFALERLGVIMSADPANPEEAWGVLNPAAARGRDGALYLYPRVVAAGNVSRIGLARVAFAGDEPVGVERLGYALEPTERYEQNERTRGCEDPRVTFIAALDCYVMAYTAYGPLGPRAALAVSEDGLRWERLGVAKYAYAPQYQTDFDLYVNKDALLFPEPVRDPHGRLALALIHRPDYNTAWWLEAGYNSPPATISERRPSMWLSYAPLEAVQRDRRQLQFWYDHHWLAGPEQPWEALKIGGGAPPLRTPLGWLTLFHGVAGALTAGVDHQPHVEYSAGALLLDLADPRRIVYRSATPILTPEQPDERHGIVDNVVFPTALDDRGNGRIDVYYGMADAKIGVARLQLPPRLPA